MRFDYDKDKAIDNKDKSFFIEGQEVLVVFAKYWIEAVENRRKAQDRAIYNPQRKCVQCGKSFKPKDSGYEFCSNKCYDQWETNKD